MKKLEVTNGIYALSMNIESMKFENMWDLPHGVSLNSYIVKGRDVAIIDGVIGWDGVPETLYENLHEMGIEIKDIKYLVVNHVEMDHSGWLNDFKKLHTDCTLVATKKGEEIIRTFYGNDLDIHVVNDGDTLDLGNGKVLSFHAIPNVHWPETMMTYEQSTKTLFPCDLYGSFGTVNDHAFDDELDDRELDLLEEEGIRYFSNVMMTYSAMLKKAIVKTRSLDLQFILPGHGIFYRKNPQKIIDDYDRWADYTNGKGEKAITIIWGSMYGSTEKMVHHVIHTLNDKGITVRTVHLPDDTQSDVLAKTIGSAGVIIAAPTYEYKMFPPVAHALDEIGRKRMTGKAVLYFGSAGWIGGAKRDFESILTSGRMDWQVVDAIEFIGVANKETYQKVDAALDQLIASIEDRIYSM